MNHINQKMKAERPHLTGLYFDDRDDFSCVYEPDDNNTLHGCSIKIEQISLIQEPGDLFRAREYRGKNTRLLKLFLGKCVNLWKMLL